MKIKVSKISINPAGTEDCWTGTETPKTNYHWTITSEEVIDLFKSEEYPIYIDGISLTPCGDGIVAGWEDPDDETLTHKKRFDCDELFGYCTTLEFLAASGEFPWNKIAETLNEYFKDYQDPLPF